MRCDRLTPITQIKAGQARVGHTDAPRNLLPMRLGVRCHASVAEEHRAPRLVETPRGFARGCAEHPLAGPKGHTGRAVARNSSQWFPCGTKRLAGERLPRMRGNRAERRDRAPTPVGQGPRLRRPHGALHESRLSMFRHACVLAYGESRAELCQARVGHTYAPRNLLPMRLGVRCHASVAEEHRAPRLVETPRGFARGCAEHPLAGPKGHTGRAVARNSSQWFPCGTKRLAGERLPRMRVTVLNGGIERRHLSGRGPACGGPTGRSTSHVYRCSGTLACWRTVRAEQSCAKPG